MRILPRGAVQFFRTPIVKIFFFLCLLGGVFIAGIVWSQLDNVDQRRTYRSAIDQAGRLSAKNSQLESVNAELNSRIIQLENKLQIDRIAYDKLTNTLNESSDYISELRSDLDFYQSIISPEDNKPGVKVHQFSVAPMNDGVNFEYKLTLVQALNHDNLVKGEVRLLVKGERNGQPIELDFESLGGSSGKLRFRYFQILQGKIKLPSDVTPKVVRVDLNVKSKKQSGKDGPQEFTWQLETG